MYNASSRIAYIVLENAADATRIIRSIEKYHVEPNLEEGEKQKAKAVADLFNGNQIVLSSLFRSSRRR